MPEGTLPVAGDLVTISTGQYCPIGIVLEQVVSGVPSSCQYVFVLWPDTGKCLEKTRDLVIISDEKS